MCYEFYDPSTESTVANSFPPGAFPEYRLNCTQLSNGAWHCSPVEQQCDSFMELGVVCINYEEFYQRSRNRTPSTHLPPIECTSRWKRHYTCWQFHHLHCWHWCTGGSVTSRISWLDSVLCYSTQESTNSTQTTVSVTSLNIHPLMFTHTNVLFILDVVYCYSPIVLMQVLSQQGAIKATHNRTSTHSSTLRPPLLIQPTVDWTEVINRRRKLLHTITLIPTR